MGEIHPIHPSANEYIYRIIKHGDKLLVQHDNRASVFDLAGKYLYDIGKQGGGPDEFSRISGLEPHDHLIYIKDSPTRIKIYDWQGKFRIRTSGDFIPSLRRTLS